MNDEINLLANIAKGILEAVLIATEGNNLDKIERALNVCEKGLHLYSRTLTEITNKNIRETKVQE